MITLYNLQQIEDQDEISGDCRNTYMNYSQDLW